MALDLAPFEDVKDKKVIVTYAELADADGERTLVEVEGTLMAVAPGIGIMVRPKGRQQGDLIPVEKLDTDDCKIEYADSAVKEIKQKALKLETPDTVRQHLVDRHGYALADINKMSPTDAFAFHESVDHGPLGHRHEEKKDKEAPATDAPAADAPTGVSDEPDHGVPSEY